MEITNKKLLYKQYLRREHQTFHESSDQEQIFYAAVRSGNLPFVKQLLAQHNLSQKTKLGTLSDSPLQSQKYHFAISAALVARHCIEGGMSREDAFLLSDYYIHKADQLLSKESLDALLYDMFLHYTQKMQQATSSNTLSKEVDCCINYIYEHLHERLTTDRLAKHIGFDRSHLSRTFKAQTGQCLSTYILNKKLETAQNMLLYSKYDIAMIAQILAFSSQSYFTSCFKKKYGQTPKHFRNDHHHKIYG